MKNLKSIAGAVAFMVLWAGAAIAMPTTFFADDDPLSTEADLVVDEEVEAIAVEEGETVEVEVPVEDEEEEGDGSDSARPDNHGKAVSTAAHCDLKGRAKGALVSSVARDKSATVESAQAACDAAVAEAAATGATGTGKPAKPGGREKPAKASAKPDSGLPAKAPKPSETETVPTDESSEVEVEPAESGPPAQSGPPADKGGGKKP